MIPQVRLHSNVHAICSIRRLTTESSSISLIAIKKSGTIKTAIAAKLRFAEQALSQERLAWKAAEVRIKAAFNGNSGSLDLTQF